MTGELSQFINNNFSFLFILLAIVHSLVAISLYKQPPARSLLKYLLIYAIGLQGIFAGLGHIFFANTLAQGIGWPTGSPFQFQVGISNLGMGVLGLLCAWKDEDFWLATVIISSVFLFGAGISHVRQIILMKNYTSLNAGSILYSDVLVPFVIIILYVIDRKKL
ncbi:MAG: hypothetical protein DKM50_09585 [Candidatus Margulisiibacteriota bacterium]|nr:MAG: hypothetical protein DKM50_09585 [Candidatus Margulisiibacteriota bacterium]